MSQPIEIFVPELAAIAAPVAREMNPVTATRLPMPILVISGGSLNFFDQSRQKTTVRARKLTDTIESSVTSQVVGIFLPKKMRFALRSAQTRYALKICWLPMIAIVNTGKRRSSATIAIFSRCVRRGFAAFSLLSTTGESGGSHLRPDR